MPAMNSAATYRQPAPEGLLLTPIN
jgi:hypothetical protein